MPILALHSVVPAFCLPDTHNRPISLWDYKHQQPLVLVFCEADCETLLRHFDAAYAQYRDTGAEVLAVLPAPPAADASFPVLIDARREVTPRFVERSPAILVLDSYGELYARLQGPWPESPDHDKILSWLTLIQMECPECGAPDWPYPLD